MQWTHLWHEAIDSTQAEARRLLAEGRPGLPLLIQAGRQLAGRGRGRHRWSSPPGGVYGTLMLPPPRHAADLAWYPAMACMAWVEVIEALAPGLLVQIKWPNDLFVNGRKVGGQLVELVAGRDGRQAVLVGSGLNVSTTGGRPLSRATSLEAEGLVSLPDRHELAARWVRNFLTFQAIVRAPNSEPKLIARFEALLWARGCRVRISTGGAAHPKAVEGVLLGVGPGARARVLALSAGTLEPRLVADGSLRVLAR